MSDTIIATYRGYAVEVESVNGEWVDICAVRCAPWYDWTHGGWALSDKACVHRDALENIRVIHAGAEFTPEEYLLMRLEKEREQDRRAEAEYVRTAGYPA